MAYDTVIQQGRFTSTGVPVELNIRSDVDWIEVINETAAYQAAADLGAKFYWQRGMTNGRGVVETKLGTVANDPLTIGQIAADLGFFLIDSSTSQDVGPSIAVTGVTNATQPVSSTANTTGLATGSVVRLINIANRQNLDNFEFEIDNVVANTSFRMRWALANNPGGAGGAGFYRHVLFEPIFYPRRRLIANITQAASAVVTLTVTHQFTVGQEVTFVIPAEFGMTELDGVTATITAISTANNTITVNVDSSAFTAFAFPLVASVPFTFAQVVPVGENTGTALTAGVDILADATRNTAFLGMRLMAGTGSPAGQNNDVIYWKAGKSFSVDNQ